MRESVCVEVSDSRSLIGLLGTSRLYCSPTGLRLVYDTYRNNWFNGHTENLLIMELVIRNTQYSCVMIQILLSKNLIHKIVG